MTLTRTSTIAVNGVELVVHEAGDPANPAVILSHGFPELAHSWRHQMAPLAAAGYHVIAPNQRGYGHSTAPTDGRRVRHPTASPATCSRCSTTTARTTPCSSATTGARWSCGTAARHRPERVRAVVGVSVPFVEWPGPPTQLMQMVYTDRFFYILYFQQVGPPEAELGADRRRTMAHVLYGASGEAMAGREMPTELPPMEGTGFLTMMTEPPALPLRGSRRDRGSTDADLDLYADEFAHSGFFGPVSWYRNLDANCEVVQRPRRRAADDAELLHHRRRRRGEADGPDRPRAHAATRCPTSAARP